MILYEFFAIICDIKTPTNIIDMSFVSALDLTQLQQKNAQLLALLGQKEALIQQQQASIQNLQHQLHLFRITRFGRKSEKDVVDAQLRLQFDDAVPVVEEEAAPGLLVAIIDAKFNRHMPLYRQEAMFAEANISITRGTLSNWMIKSADLLLALITGLGQMRIRPPKIALNLTKPA